MKIQKKTNYNELDKLPVNYMTLTMNYSIENAIMDFIPVNQSITYVEKSSEMAPKFTTTTLIKVIVLLSMVIISLIGNVATMWSIKQNNKIRRKNRHTWTAVYLLIFHLSFADLLVTMFCTLGDAIWLYTVQWLAGNFMCKIVKYFQMFSLYLSTYVLVLIGIDRWIAVKYPMKSLQMGKRCYHFLTIGYTLSAIFSLPQVSISLNSYDYYSGFFLYFYSGSLTKLNLAFV